MTKQGEIREWYQVAKMAAREKAFFVNVLKNKKTFRIPVPLPLEFLGVTRNIKTTPLPNYVVFEFDNDN